MQKVIIAAKSDNDVIGKDNDLAWELPADEAFFNAQIRDCWLLTGRASFESPQGREIFRDRPDVIVLTRQRNYRAGRALVAHSVDEAFRLARRGGARRLCILGGAQVYAITIDRADELIITEIHTEVEGDACFPPIDPARWQETSREDHRRDAANPHDYSFVRYRRRFV